MTKILALLLLASPVVLAETAQPSHNCTKPAIPAQFKDQAEADQFSHDVEGYNKCISAFVEEQNEAVRTHRAAAQQATEEWNAFASELK